MKNNRYFFIAIALLLVSQWACVKKPDALPQVTNSQSLLTILKNNYDFSMFYSALQRTGLDKTLEGKGPYTLLVPDNDAFSNSGISADSLAKIDTATLKKLLNYHIIQASIPYASIPQAIDINYKTQAGLPVYFSVPLPGDKQFQNLTLHILHINGVTADKTDIAASNGYIIALSRVLYYPAPSVKAFLENSPQYSYFTQALKQFGLFDQLDKPGPFVILAPSNDVFIQNGIDEATIAKLDTLTYKKFLFSPYVLSPYLFFLTDLKDAPLAGASPPGVVTPDFVLALDCSNLTYSIMALNYLQIEASYTPPYYGNPYIYGPPVNFINTDHIAVNGVVHGLNGLVMIPDSAKVHP